jgi:23S rRNA (cytidine1920-2'-O)/16S rRNA (cytidine1409-2'-O)-methyltransferase
MAAKERPRQAAALQKKRRVDMVMVERGLAPTRAKAQALIMARRVQLNGAFVDKPGTPVAAEAEITITELEHPYVGRGGVKLQKALTHFGIELRDKICADLGASTGGFTDVMLRAGAGKVYAIDVGYGQLDMSLRSDPRVVIRERMNARYLERSDFYETADFVSVDVSFISLRLVLPRVLQFLSQQGDIVVLIKPQFEVGKGEVGKGGVVRDEARRAAAREGILEFARSLALEVRGWIESPIRGAAGNVEYLAHLRRGTDTPADPPATIPEPPR